MISMLLEKNQKLMCPKVPQLLTVEWLLPMPANMMLMKTLPALVLKKFIVRTALCFTQFDSHPVPCFLRVTPNTQRVISSHTGMGSAFRADFVAVV